MKLLQEVRNYMGNYHVKSGVYHYYRNEFAQAVTFLRKALGDEPKLTEGDLKNARSYLTLSLRGLAEKLIEKGEHDQAVEALERAIEINPDYPDSHFRLAQVLRERGRLAEAIDAFRRAVACHPRYLDARVGLADCLIDAGRREEAVSALREALALRLAAIARPFEEGLELLSNDEVAAARERFACAFTAIPQLAGEHLDRAQEWARQREHDKALDELAHAIVLHPGYPDLHNFRGLLLCELERYDEAIVAFERSAELGPQHVVPRLNRAFAFVRAERHAEAESALEQILAEHPDEPAATAKLEELRALRGAEARSAAPRGGAR